MSDNNLPNQTDSLRTIEGHAFDHSLCGDVLQLEKNFSATLAKQYRDIIVSCYLEVSLRNAHDLSSPLGVLARDIPQHALIVIRQLLKDAALCGVSTIPLWHGFNTIRNHVGAKTTAMNAVLDERLHQKIPVTRNFGIYWPKLIATFKSCLDELYHQPQLQDTLFEHIRGKYGHGPGESIRFWPPAAQALFLEDPERGDFLNTLKPTVSSAASMYPEESSVAIHLDTVRPDPTTRSISAVVSATEAAISAASVNSAEFPCLRLPGDVQTLIEDYFSLMAPCSADLVVVGTCGL